MLADTLILGLAVWTHQSRTITSSTQFMLQKKQFLEHP